MLSKVYDRFIEGFDTEDLQGAKALWDELRPRDILAFYSESFRKGTCMLSVKGTFQNGVARPSEPVAEYEGHPVIITFLEEEPARVAPAALEEGAWDALSQLVEDCGVETSITDFAHQHDHYLYGKPKKA